MKENQVILKRQKDSMWFKLDEVRPLAFFVILACLVGWIPYIFAAVGDNGSPTNWPFGPLVAAAIVSAFLGRAGLKTWWRRLTTFRAAPGWYILAFVAPVVIVMPRCWPTPHLAHRCPQRLNSPNGPTFLAYSLSTCSWSALAKRSAGRLSPRHYCAVIPSSTPG